MKILFILTGYQLYLPEDSLDEDIAIADQIFL